MNDQTSMAELFRAGSRAHHHLPRPSESPGGVRYGSLDWERIRKDYEAAATEPELYDPFAAGKAVQKQPSIIKARKSRAKAPGEGPGRGKRSTPHPMKVAPDVEERIVRLYTGGEHRPGFLIAHSGLSKSTIYRILRDAGVYNPSERKATGKYTKAEYEELARVKAARLAAERSES